MDSLKPCPFCGGDAEIMYYKPVITSPSASYYAYVRCLSCGAMHHVHRIDCDTTEKEAVNEVIEAWNRRANEIHN